MKHSFTSLQMIQFANKFQIFHIFSRAQKQPPETFAHAQNATVLLAEAHK